MKGKKVVFFKTVGRPKILAKLFLVARLKCVPFTEDGNSMTTFYYYSVNHQSGLQRNTFPKLSYIFLIHQNVSQIMSFHLWWFHRSKDFEAMKAGKLVIRPWLSCPYNEHTLVDLPSSVVTTQYLPLCKALDWLLGRMLELKLDLD